MQRKPTVEYITIGALIVICTGVWNVYLLNNPSDTLSYYWCTGFLVTGLTMVLIGLVLGYLGRSARVAELAASPALLPSSPPVVVVDPPANAAAAPAAAPVNTVAGGVGQDVVVPASQGNGLLAGIRSQGSAVR